MNREKDFELYDVGSDKLVTDILPLISPTGDLQVVRGKDAIISSIRTLLLTPRGLYPFDPEYGSELHKQLFEFMDSVTERTIYYEVKTVIEKYIPSVTVDSVDMEWLQQDKACKVDVYFSIVDDVNKTKLSVNIMNLVNNHMFNSLEDTYSDGNQVS